MPRVARARRPDRQGSTELPGRVVARQDPHPRLRRQYSQLIARRVREAQVYCELHPFDVGEEFIRRLSPRGIFSPAARLGYMKMPRPRPPTRSSSSVPGAAGSATACRPCGAARRPSREFPGARVRIRRSRARGHSRLLEGIQDRVNGETRRPARRVDEPRRQGHGAPARLQGDREATKPLRSPQWPTRRANSNGVQFHPEVDAYAPG